MKCQDPECLTGDHGEHWRCAAHRTKRDPATGKKVPCKGNRIRGGTTCRAHGGAAPQVQKSARERLHELASPAVAALSAALGMVEKHPGIALNPSVQRAALGVLDRCGLGPSSHVSIEDVTEEHGKQVASILSDVLAALGVDLGDPATRRVIRGRLEADGEAAVAKWRREHPPPKPEPEPERPAPRGVTADTPENEDEEDEVTL